MSTKWRRIAHLQPEILTRLRLGDPSLALARGRAKDISHFYACIAELQDDGYHFLLELTRDEWLGITIDGERDLLAREMRWAPNAEPPWLTLVQATKHP